MNNHKTQYKISQLKRHLTILVIALGLAACGQKGPLVLPETTPSNQQQQDENKDQPQE